MTVAFHMNEGQLLEFCVPEKSPTYFAAEQENQLLIPKVEQPRLGCSETRASLLIVSVHSMAALAETPSSQLFSSNIGISASEVQLQ